MSAKNSRTAACKGSSLLKALVGNLGEEDSLVGELGSLVLEEGSHLVEEGSHLVAEESSHSPFGTGLGSFFEQIGCFASCEPRQRKCSKPKLKI